MARGQFGGTAADFRTNDRGDTSAGGTGTVWREQAKTNQITDLLDVDGTPISTVTAAASPKGMVQFQGPDDDTYVVWVDFGGGAVKMVAADRVAAAANLSFAPTGGIAATTVQGAIAELDTEKASAAFTPSGGIAATTVHAAIAELDTEKAPLASPVLSGNPTAPTASPGDNDTTIATTAYVTAADTAHAAVTATHGATGAVVGTTNAQTLTNKSLTSATLTGTTDLPGAGTIDSAGIVLSSGCWASAALRTTQALTNVTWTALTVATTSPTNVGGFTNPTTARIAVPTTGLYLVTAQVQWAALAATTRYAAAVAKNSGGTYAGTAGTGLYAAEAKSVALDLRSAVTTGDTPTSEISQIVSLVAGDYLELWGFQGSGGAVNATGSANANETFLRVTLISAAT